MARCGFHSPACLPPLGLHHSDLYSTTAITDPSLRSTSTKTIQLHNRYCWVGLSKLATRQTGGSSMNFPLLTTSCRLLWCWRDGSSRSGVGYTIQIALLISLQSLYSQTASTDISERLGRSHELSRFHHGSVIACTQCKKCSREISCSDAVLFIMNMKVIICAVYLNILDLMNLLY